MTIMAKTVRLITSFLHEEKPNSQHGLRVLFHFLLVVPLLLLPGCQAQEESMSFRAYHLISSQEIQSTLLEWQDEYPDLIQVYTAQDSFGLSTAGSTSLHNDCPFDQDVEGCLNYYAVLQDYVAHPINSRSSKQLPTVLLSGELHGDERVGPTSVMETARLLLEAATCEALSRYSPNNSTTLQQQQLQESESCRTLLYQTYGMTKAQQQWLARLLSTRRVLLVPTANALGYDRNSRLEGNFDPNRDFGYDQLSSEDCMQTIAARTLNELFRHYLITNSFTFHGGTELLGYEWGNPSHFGTVSPDDIAQNQLAHAYATYGGGFDGANGRDHPPYLYGDMNSIIYYVRGGFEDYAYAGSWDTQNMMPCQPTTFGGYPIEKTIYEPGMLRSFNMLVETSWVKDPDDNDLGTSWNVLWESSEIQEKNGDDNDDDMDRYFSRNGKTKNHRQKQENKRQPRHLRGGALYTHPTPRQSLPDRFTNGHIPRNIRLALASIDLVQPYLRLTSIQNTPLRDDIIPLLPPSLSASSSPNRGGSFCKLPPTSFADPAQRFIQHAMETGLIPVVSIPMAPNVTEIPLEWTVGGAMTIDATKLWAAQISTFNNSYNSLVDATQWLEHYLCGEAEEESFSVSGHFQSSMGEEAQSGTGFFSPYGGRPRGDRTNMEIMGPVFMSVLDLNNLKITAALSKQTTITLVVIASARVDASWTDLPFDAPVGPAQMTPQSHMVQSRNNASWHFENMNGYVIQGQEEFYSRPVLLQLRAMGHVDNSDKRDNSHGDNHEKRAGPSESLNSEAATMAATETDAPSPSQTGIADGEEFAAMTHAPTNSETVIGSRLLY